MRLEEQAQGGRFLIQGYGDGGFRIAGRRYQGSVLVLPGGVFPWTAGGLSDISYESFQPAIDAAGDIDVLLLGSGPSIAPVDRALLRRLRDDHGIAIDVMDTGAACRTFNVLLTDGRQVAAALIPVV
jgi:uncharacterized protein